MKFNPTFKTVIFLLSVFIFIVFTSQKCNNKSIEASVPNNSNTTEKPKDPVFKFNYNDTYANNWKVVDSLQTLGLYKSSLEAVTQIFDKAKKEENHPQVIKALMHKLKYNSYIKDEDFVKAIAELDSIALVAKFPLKQITHAVIADVYWGYYQANQWEISQRTFSDEIVKSDVRTWDLRTLAHRIVFHRIQSTSEASKLQQLPLSAYKDILRIDGYSLDTHPYENFEKFTPTLFDFLALESIKFFQTASYNVSQNEDKYILDNPAILSNNANFIMMNHQSKDSLSNHYYAVELFKALTLFHIKDVDPTILVTITIKRIEFAKNYAVLENKDELYISLVNELEKLYASHETSTQFSYLKAYYFHSKNNPKNKDNPTELNGNKLAHEIANNAIKLYPKSFGAQQCNSLINTLEAKSLDITLDKFLVPNATQKLKLTYANIDKVYLTLLSVPKDYKNTEYDHKLKVEHFLKNGTKVKSWEQNIKNLGDFNKHSIELPIDPMDFGHYVLLVSSSPDLSINNNAVHYSQFRVTNFTYQESRVNANSLEMYVFNRTTGLPQSKVKVNLYRQDWNSIQRKYEYKKIASYTTDNLGKITYQISASYYNIFVELENEKDYYFSDHGTYIYKDNYKPKNTPVTHFFLDRKIYRPGQTIYFKGIVTQKTDKDVMVVPNQEVTVQLKDVNYQKVTELRLKTNDYGSYSGQFTAPSGVLTGNMTLVDNYGSTYFRVEEYKRPKFEVNFKPIEGVFKLDQDVAVTGIAQAFAGNAIDGAEVKYSITRSARFPYWCWYRFGFMPNSNQTQVTTGTVTTNEKGEFTINFKAKGDASINLKYSPIYSYTVSADVTDINGETRSGSVYVNVGKNAMELNIIANAENDLKKFNFFRVQTRNLNYQPVNAKGELTISSLVVPNKIYKKRTWSAPDLNHLSKDEFVKLFPNDVYENEHQIENYPIDKVVFKTSFDTEKTDTIFTKNSNLKPGIYKFEAKSIDIFGEEVLDVKYITIYDNTSAKPVSNDIFSVRQVKSTLEPGENAEFILASATDVYVKYVIAHQGEIIKEGVINLKNEQQKFSFPIIESYRGSMSFYFTTFRLEEYVSITKSVYVPFSNKELKIEFETFRNKLLPGQEETWKIKLSGPKSEKVAAEMVATMYDASLDAFASNYFDLYVNYAKTNYYYYPNNYFPCYGKALSGLLSYNWNPYVSMPYRSYPELNWFGYNTYRYNNQNLYRYYDGIGNSDGDYSESLIFEESDNTVATGQVLASTVSRNSKALEAPSPGSTRLEEKEKEETAKDGKTILYFSSNRGNGGEEQLVQDNSSQDLSGVQARSNFNETAFFFPHLETNAKGEIIFSFTIPESLTKWKFLSLAHTKDLKKGSLSDFVVTQKDLMVVPNAPRFFREKDQIVLTTKISNLTESAMEGNVQLFLIDPLTNKAIDVELKNNQAQKRFTADAKQSTSVSWNLTIPIGLQALTYKIVAKSGNFTDGEEMTLPVLTNRMLVTESLPIYNNKKGTKQFELSKLVNNKSTTLTHHNLTLEYTSNPAWYAIQALPYMMEYPYECAEQTFTRYYANALAAHVANSSPKIKAVFDAWVKEGKEAFMSNLEKNQELKALFLEETPWVFNAHSEAESKKRVGLLFDLHKMQKELDKALTKLEKEQSANGGWAWFKGFKENRYITQHIISGMGHLNKLGVINSTKSFREWKMIKKGVEFLDYEIIQDYKWLVKHAPNYKNERHVTSIQIQYLYARSYFDFPVSKNLEEAYNYYLGQTKKYWLENSLQTRAMIALTLHRLKDADGVQTKVMKHLKELSILNEEMGAYFKENEGGYYWDNAPIETHALIIEAFDEIANDAVIVEDLKIWLLKQKQTTHWKTTKSTANACYALLLKGTNLLANEEVVDIKLGDMKIVPEKVEAGTGYFKKSWTAKEIKPEMGRFTITKQQDGASWGALYWQYFEDLDKITPHNTPLKITKKLFKVQIGSNGEYMTSIENNGTLKVGDKVRVRVEIYTDRNLEYVHLKDMRASGFEPINVLSQYKYRHGLGYYEATKDASTNFFIDYLAKGTYVFEYDLRVFHQGDFSNGITTIQCMYAPEFTSHSEGIRVVVKE